MKIRMTSNALLIAFLWVIGCMINAGTIFILRTNKAFLATLAPMLIIIFILSALNIIYFVRVYKDFLTLTDDSIVVNNGLLYKKKTLNLSDVKSVKYNKNNMIFYMADGRNKIISLAFISKGDEIALYKFLTTKSISVIT